MTRAALAMLQPSGYQDLGLSWLEEVILSSPCSISIVMLLTAVLFFSILAYWNCWWPLKGYKGLLFQLLDEKDKRRGDHDPGK